MKHKFEAFFRILSQEEFFRSEFIQLKEYERIGVKKICNNVAKKNQIQSLEDLRYFMNEINRLIKKKRKKKGVILIGPLSIIEDSVDEAGKLVKKAKEPVL
jgi:hypothetical protein